MFTCGVLSDCRMLPAHPTVSVGESRRSAESTRDSPAFLDATRKRPRR